jgi:hypothetical protein
MATAWPTSWAITPTDAMSPSVPSSRPTALAIEAMNTSSK